MTEQTHEQARSQAFDLLRLAHDSLSASLRFDYFSNGKGHKQSKAVLGPDGARRPSAGKKSASVPSSAQAHITDRTPSLENSPPEDAELTSLADLEPPTDPLFDKVDAQPVDASDITARYLAEVGERHRLTSSEEYRLARRAVDGDPAACRQLVEHHLGLVVMMARRYVGRGLPLLDLIEEGNLGLLTATSKFDPELGYRLSTYAKWWIRESIEMALMTQTRVVRVPVHLSRSAKQVAKRVGAGGETPDNASEGSGLSSDLVALLDDDDRDGSVVLQDLEAADESRPESACSFQQRDAQLNAALGALSQKERLVIERRFGLGQEEPGTLEVIGKELNLTYERVRQIEKAALIKLRDIFEKKGISWDALL